MGSDWVGNQNLGIGWGNIEDSLLEKKRKEFEKIKKNSLAALNKSALQYIDSLKVEKSLSDQYILLKQQRKKYEEDINYLKKNGLIVGDKVNLSSIFSDNLLFFLNLIEKNQIKRIETKDLEYLNNAKRLLDDRIDKIEKMEHLLGYQKMKSKKETVIKKDYPKKTLKSTINYWIRPNKIENLSDKTWEHAKNTEKIQTGDKIILYVSGIKKLAGIATMGEDRQFHFDDPNNESNWVNMPPEEFLKELDYINEKNFDFSTNNWKGLIVQSTYKISKQDYHKFKTYIFEKNTNIQEEKPIKKEKPKVKEKKAEESKEEKPAEKKEEKEIKKIGKISLWKRFKNFIKKK